MHRTWTALTPCPIAKELIPVHPRKVFYYLTVTPRQELPSSDSDILPCIVGGRGKGSPKRIISPSLSNASQDDDDPSTLEDRRRTALSPSPEIDLTFDLDDVVHSAVTDTAPDFPSPPATTPASFSNSRSSMGREGSNPDRDLGLNRRAESPPLEGDEQEFTATARGMRLRGMSMDELNRIDTKLVTIKTEGEMTEPSESEEERAKRSSEAAETLFGSSHHHHHHHHHQAQPQSQGGMILSSPMVKPVAAAVGMNGMLDHTRDARFKNEQEAMGMATEGTSILGDSVFGLGWEISRPENVDLDELDDLLDGC